MDTMTMTATEQHIRVVQQAYAEFATGNIPGLVNLCTADIIWTGHANAGVPYARTYEGKNGVAQFFRTLDEAIAYSQFETREFYAEGDRVFVKGYHAGMVKATGKTFGHDFLMEFQLSGERINYFFAWGDTAEQAAAFANTVSDQNKKIVRRFNTEVVENNNTDAFREIISPAFINHSAPPGVSNGPDGVLYFFNEFLRPAFPDLKVDILFQVAENDVVTTHKVFQATHRGPFMGVPATRKRISIEVMDIIRLKQGQFVEHWCVVDWQAVLAQLSAQ